MRGFREEMVRGDNEPALWLAPDVTRTLLFRACSKYTFPFSFENAFDTFFSSQLVESFTITCVKSLNSESASHKTTVLIWKYIINF